MSSPPRNLPPSGADPTGSGRGAVDGAPENSAGDLGLDPIFQAAEPAERSPKSVVLLWQFFFFPLLVVAAAVGVFVAFGAIGGGTRTPKELLQEVLTGGENAQKQASKELASAMADERNRIDAGKDPEKPPFYAEPEFLRDLVRALENARKEDQSEGRQEWLAMALGRTGQPEVIPVLLSVLYPEQGPEGRAAPPTGAGLRLAAAWGLQFLESRAAESALVRASSDDDAEVRDVAVNGLAFLGLPAHGGAASDGPRVRPALLRALTDDHAGVRLNAAYALALRGDATGRDMIERSLDREALERLDVRADLRRGSLKNAIRGATELKDPALRPLIERLTDDGDPLVRGYAREALARWDGKEKD